MHRTMRLCGLLAVIGLTGRSASAVTPNIEPMFVGTPYEVTVDVSPPGLESFSFTGSAVDTPDETLRYFPPSLPFGFTFSSTVGNPASFTLEASGLTYQYIGVYTVVVEVYDNNQFSSAAAAGVVVRIVPEPSFVNLLFSAAFFQGHRRSSLRST